LWIGILDIETLLKRVAAAGPVDGSEERPASGSAPPAAAKSKAPPPRRRKDAPQPVVIDRIV
jgi:hypothetical protein